MQQPATDTTEVHATGATTTMTVQEHIDRLHARIDDLEEWLSEMASDLIERMEGAVQ